MVQLVRFFKARRPLMVLVIVVVGIFLSACAPVHQEFGPGDIEYYETGKDLIPGLPYVSGDPRILARKKELDASINANDLANKVIEFSRQIESISFVGLTSEKENGKPVIENPAAFELKVTVRTSEKTVEELVFKNAFTANGNGKVIPFTRAQGKPNFSITGNCTDSNCRDLTEIQLERTKGSGGKVLPNGKADLYGRGYWATASTKTTLSAAVLQGLSKDMQDKYTKIKSSQYSFVQNWAIYYGISQYQASVYSYSGKGTPPKGFRPEVNINQLEWLMTFNGAAARTTDHKIGAQIDPRSPLRPNEVSLYGDDASSDARIFNVVFGTPKTPNGFEVAMTIEGFETQLLKPTTPGVKFGKLGLSASAYLKSPSYDSDPNVKKIINDLEENWSLTGVATWVSHFSKNRIEREALERSYQRAFFIRPLIEKIYTHFNIPPPLVYIQLFETNFWKSPYLSSMFNPLQKADGSSACGPSQIINDTAKSLGMFVRSGSCLAGKWNVAGPVTTTNSKGKTVTVDERRDERVYPAAAICATARLMSRISKEYEGHDQTFVIAGYYLGEDGARAAAYCAQNPKVSGGSLACLQTVNTMVHDTGSVSSKTAKDAVNFFRKNNMTFADLSRFKSVPPKLVFYTHMYLAKYFISGNPAQFGVSVPTPEYFDVPPYLFPPAGWTSKNWDACEKSIQGLDSKYINHLYEWSEQTKQRLNDLGQKR